jgi:hypothetical protein
MLPSLELRENVVAATSVQALAKISMSAAAQSSSDALAMTSSRYHCRRVCDLGQANLKATTIDEDGVPMPIGKAGSRMLFRWEPLAQDRRRGTLPFLPVPFWHLPCLHVQST